MIWEGEPIMESVEKLKAIGMKSMVFAPCGNVPETGDFLSVVMRNLENLKKRWILTNPSHIGENHSKYKRF